MGGTDARDKAVSSTWYLGAAQVLGTGSTYLLLAALTRMGTELYGTWVLALMMVSYLSPWAGLGLGSGLVRYLPGVAAADRFARLKLVRRASFAAAMLLAAGLVLAAEPLAAAWLGGAENARLVWLVAALFPLEAQLLIGYSYFQALERMGTYAALSAARHLLELSVLSALVFFGAELWMLLAARAGSLLLLVAVQQILVRESRVAGTAVPAGELGRMMRFGFPMIPASFVWILIMGIDRFMLEYYGRLPEVGIYNVADALAAFLLNATRPINGVLQPRFANLMEVDSGEIGRYLRRAGKYLALLLLPGAVGLAVVAGPLVDLVTTPDFAAAAAIVPILTGAYLLIGLSNPIYHLVFLRRGGRAFLWLYPLCLTVNVSLNIALIPTLGGVGAAWATLAGFAAYIIGLALQSERGHLAALAGDVRALAGILACSLGMGAAMLALRAAFPPLGGWALVPLGMGIYALLVRLMAVVSVEERDVLLAPLLGGVAALRGRLRAHG